MYLCKKIKGGGGKPPVSTSMISLCNILKHASIAGMYCIGTSTTEVLFRFYHRKIILHATLNLLKDLVRSFRP